MNSRLIIKMIVPIALTAGLLLGLFTPAIATAQWSFAGYRQSLTNIATQSQIPYANPNVPTGQSLEWALAANGSGSVFVQSGWIKKSGWTDRKSVV